MALPWQIRGEKIPFHIRTFGIPYQGRHYRVQIARPITKLDEEIREVLFMLAGGMIVSFVVLVLISRLFAARILKPVADIKKLSRKISVQNLDQRLPVGPEHDALSELAETINWMLDRLQKSFVRQRDFLFDSSHELKTPLATMRLAIGQILESDSHSLLPATRENLLRTQEQVLRMDRLVKDLLNLSSLETMTKIESNSVDVAKILEALADDYRLPAEARKIRISMDLSDIPPIPGDEGKLCRAFSNLLDNALKYNLDGGTVAVEGRASESAIRIAISNTGPGIPESETGKIFQQFYRIELSRSSRYGGSGLGLTIVRRIVELHRGRVEVESTPGEQTTFTVILPRHSESPP
jgi:signal transduction histidine kinase